ncbi:MAG: VWA domain-containing protein [Bacteroidales bacterium]
MHTRFVASIIFLLLFVQPVKSLHAQSFSSSEKTKKTTRILFVFDASRSMYGKWEDETKIDIARRLMGELLDSLRKEKNLQLALRVYGHQHHFPPQNCDDTKLEVPFSKDNTDRIKYKLKTIIPKGTTPIALSMKEAADDYPPCDNCRNIMILITDGIEECGGDPCEVSLKLQKKGIMLKPFIIGVGKDFRDAFECAGTYFDARNSQEFRSALNIAINKAINPTTAQVNLLDVEGNPTETNVNMTFYNKVSGEFVYNFMHTINAKGNPDTLELDPMITYEIDIHTIPPVHIDSFGLTPGKHNIAGVDAPQGNLEIALQGRKQKDHHIQCIVREQGDMKTLNLQHTGKREKYLIGKYDLEILTLPRINVEGVAVRQNHTTTIDIPTPGIAMIRMGTHGYGSIYKQENDGSLKWLYNLPENTQQESVYLLPGHYKVVFRSKATTHAKYTREVDFEITPGEAKTISVYK